MAAKDLVFDTEARAALKRGVDKLAEAVKHSHLVEDALPSMRDWISDMSLVVVFLARVWKRTRKGGEARSWLIKAAGQAKNRSRVSYWTLARLHPDDKKLRREATERLVQRLMDGEAYVRVAAARARTGSSRADHLALHRHQSPPSGRERTLRLRPPSSRSAAPRPPIRPAGISRRSSASAPARRNP